MKVLVCGDRNWTDRECIRSWLSKLQDWGYDTVIEGEARGADTIAMLEAHKLGMVVIPYPAEWTRFGIAAGPIRNRQMLDECEPDMVLAFHPDISQSRGTKDMVNYAISRGYKRGYKPIIVTGK